jgi:hypothetical protein
VIFDWGEVGSLTPYTTKTFERNKVMQCETTHNNSEESTERNAIVLQRSLADVVAEYDEKLAAVPRAIAEFEDAGNALKMSACVGGTWGDSRIDTGSVAEWKVGVSTSESPPEVR